MEDKRSVRDYLALALAGSAVLGVAVSYWKVYLFHVVLVLCLLAAVVFSPRRPKLAAEKSHYFVYAFFAWYAVTLIWSMDRFHGLEYLAYISFGALLLIFIVSYAGRRKEGGVDTLFRVLAFLFILDIIFAVLEALGLLRLPISPHSRFLYLFRREGTDMSALDAEGIKHFRSIPTGFNWNPNDLSVAMLIALPFFLLAKRIWLRVVGSAVLLFVIFAAGTRGALVTFVIVIVASILFSKKKLPQLGLVAALAILIVGGFGLSQILGLSNLSKIRSSFAAITQYLSRDPKTDESVNIRRQLIRNGLEAFVQSKGLGVGAGASNRVQVLKANTQGITSMHNFWVEVLVEGGAIGFILFAGGYVLVVFRLIRSKDPSLGEGRDYYRRATALSLIAFAIGCISASSVIYFLPFWALLAFGVAQLNSKSSP